ncbi:unnamed protein product [Caretta caretta]
MDRGSRFFYALEKTRGPKKHITCLLAEDVTPLTEPVEMYQEKAFNRVDHGYLLSTLQAFGFGPQFVGFLRVLYTSAECLVKLNWTLTEPVSFGRLTGLVLWELELRLVLSAYADDMLLMVQDLGHLARVEACQAIYSAASSARVNWVKSSGLVFGRVVKRNISVSTILAKGHNLFFWGTFVTLRPGGNQLRHKVKLTIETSGNFA